MSKVHYDHLIIGGGIAGTSAAESIRAKDASASIAVIGSEPHLLYSRVLLPHVVRGKIAEEKAFLKNADFFSGKNISYMPGVTVASVDAAAHRAIFADGAECSWGKLLIATGGTPRKLGCPGEDAADIMRFQTIDDARLLTAVSAGPALTVGGGFIALELLLSFAVKGFKNLAIVRGKSFFWRGLDEASAERVRETLAKHGIEMKFGVGVKAIESDRLKKNVFLTNGEKVECAVIGAGVGLEPNIGFLAGSGIEVRRGVVADEKLRTSAADVYAAGDVAEYFDGLVGEHHIVGNWTNATMQGKRAGSNMVGEDAVYDQLTGYSINCFELPITFIGAVDIEPDSRIVRKDTEGGILQMRLREGRIIAATKVGHFSERAAITSLIRGRTIMDKAKINAAADPMTDLSGLI